MRRPPGTPRHYVLRLLRTIGKPKSAEWKTRHDSGLRNQGANKFGSSHACRVVMAPRRRPVFPDPAAADSCNNICLSVDVLNPFNRSRNWPADGDGWVRLRLVQVSRAVG